MFTCCLFTGRLPIECAYRKGSRCRSDIIRLLDKIEDERGQDAARQVFAFLRRIFNWYAIRDDDFRSPVVPGMMKRQNGDRGRERVLSDDELRQVWTATEKL